jgi:hypothetical protein
VVHQNEINAIKAKLLKEFTSKLTVANQNIKTKMQAKVKAKEKADLAAKLVQANKDSAKVKLLEQLQQGAKDKQLAA